MSEFYRKRLIDIINLLAEMQRKIEKKDYHRIYITRIKPNIGDKLKVISMYEKESDKPEIIELCGIYTGYSSVESMFYYIFRDSAIKETYSSFYEKDFVYDLLEAEKIRLVKELEEIEEYNKNN
jgi:hypothetical protein